MGDSPRLDTWNSFHRHRDCDRDSLLELYDCPRPRRHYLQHFHRGRTVASLHLTLPRAWKRDSPPCSLDERVREYRFHHGGSRPESQEHTLSTENAPGCGHGSCTLHHRTLCALHHRVKLVHRLDLRTINRDPIAATKRS